MVSPSCASHAEEVQQALVGVPFPDRRGRAVVREYLVRPYVPPLLLPSAAGLLLPLVSPVSAVAARPLVGRVDAPPPAGVTGTRVAGTPRSSRLGRRGPLHPDGAVVDARAWAPAAPVPGEEELVLSAAAVDESAAVIAERPPPLAAAVELGRDERVYLTLVPVDDLHQPLYLRPLLGQPHVSLGTLGLETCAPRLPLLLAPPVGPLDADPRRVLPLEPQLEVIVHPLELREPTALVLDEADVLLDLLDLLGHQSLVAGCHDVGPGLLRLLGGRARQRRVRGLRRRALVRGGGGRRDGAGFPVPPRSRVRLALAAGRRSPRLRPALSLLLKRIRAKGQAKVSDRSGCKKVSGFSLPLPAVAA